MFPGRAADVHCVATPPRAPMRGHHQPANSVGIAAARPLPWSSLIRAAMSPGPDPARSPSGYTRDKRRVPASVALHAACAAIFVLFAVTFVLSDSGVFGLSGAVYSATAADHGRATLSWAARDTVSRFGLRGGGEKEDGVEEEVARLSPEELPACSRGGARAKTMLLLFMGHSGSTAIISALQQHSEMHVEGYEPVDHGEIQWDTAAALAYAEEFFKKAIALGKMGGFKIRPRHLLKAPAAWAKLMDTYETRIVWNYRSNTMKASIGHYPIKFNGSKLAYEGIPVEEGDAVGGGLNDTEEAPMRSLKIENMEGLAKIVRERTAGEVEVEKALRSLGKSGRSHECTLPISYEAFLHDARGAVSRVQQFLGISTDELHLPLRRKATHDNLCELVENHEELCNAFFGCVELRWMLEDPACTCNKLVTSSVFNSRKFCP
jgi:hypothetical protein